MLSQAQLKGALLTGRLENDFLHKYHGHLGFVTEPSEDKYVIGWTQWSRELNLELDGWELL